MAHPRGAPAPFERRGKPCFIEIRRAKFVAIRGPARQKARQLSDGGEGGGCGELGGGGGEGSAWFGGGGFELRGRGCNQNKRFNDGFPPTMGVMRNVGSAA